MGFSQICLRMFNLYTPRWQTILCAQRINESLRVCNSWGTEDGLSTPHFNSVCIYHLVKFFWFIFGDFPEIGQNFNCFSWIRTRVFCCISVVCGPSSVNLFLVSSDVSHENLWDQTTIDSLGTEDGLSTSPSTPIGQGILLHFWGLCPLIDPFLAKKTSFFEIGQSAMSDFRFRVEETSNLIKKHPKRHCTTTNKGKIPHKKKKWDHWSDSCGARRLRG